ncbi:MAG: FliM/FliN family flagellar motor switch protein, partial [Deltaproteobacteria bacterium]|nr:FliM/FliN family flagellar motor switch protein [Deltaproteobacteria bacterium]
DQELGDEMMDEGDDLVEMDQELGDEMMDEGDDLVEMDQEFGDEMMDLETETLDDLTDTLPDIEEDLEEGLVLEEDSDEIEEEFEFEDEEISKPETFADEAVLDVGDLSSTHEMDISEDVFMDDHSDMGQMELIASEGQDLKKSNGVEGSIFGKSLLLSLPHKLTVEIGSASLKGEDITNLTYGSVIELDKKVGEPIDIVLGDKVVAQGEVVQINQENLGVRITRINL